MAGKGAHPSEKDVLAFLRKNPHFLERHPELFEAMVSGREGAGEKVQNIREHLLKKTMSERDALKKRLDSLLAAAREREEIEGKLRALERIIFRSRSLPSMLSRVAEELKRLFGLEEVCLSLKGGLDESLRGPSQEAGGPIIEVEEKLLEDLFQGDEPLLRGGMKRGNPPFFRHGEGLRSEALLPLRLDEELFGSLNLGSRSPERYHPELGVQLLKRFAFLLSVGIESLRERERLRRGAAFDEETAAIHPERLREFLSSEFSRADRYGNPLSLLLLLFGSEAKGCLPPGARLLKGRIRGSDILIRGKDASLVLLLPMTPLEGATKAGSRFSSLIIEEVLRPEALEEHNLFISLSAHPEGGAKSWEELLAQAERFLPGGPE